MPTRPKTRKTPAKPSSVDKAIARAKAAQAAYDAAAGQSDETLASLCAAESDACAELAETHCTNDAEFIEKLKYLLARETRQSGELHFGLEYGSVLVAVATHLGELGGDA